DGSEEQAHGEVEGLSNLPRIESAFLEGQERRPGATKARWRPVLPLSRRCEKKAAASQEVHPGTSSMDPWDIPVATRLRRTASRRSRWGFGPGRVTTEGPKRASKRWARSSDTS